MYQYTYKIYDVDANKSVFITLMEYHLKIQSCIPRFLYDLRVGCTNITDRCEQNIRSFAPITNSLFCLKWCTGEHIENRQLAFNHL